ncbi:hypothetical protein [Microbacterium sp. SORGH_AS_0862]|uniref:hypothetical protein n=1 Tax=Microbacterium sp. SORGH_AS_0862 TaxID=3041789 RepID=UPI002792092E|nr:hypothetical protein [Microbacterium sp. SORGH_AS_0862]MDQ1205911.1 hypothetical protein [Microbacterium sp. SORGH_AS_0862]
MTFDPAPPTAGSPPVLPQTIAPAAPRRRSRGAGWIIGLSLSLVLTLLLAAGTGGAWLIWQQREWLLASRVLSPEQESAIADTFAAASDKVTATQQATARYESDRRAWDDEHAQVEQWKTGTDAPLLAVPNPGGRAMPGPDPDGRAFLSSIGADRVQVAFDAGDENCGYHLSERTGYEIVVGGCYSTRYPGWLFIAWDPGMEASVWPVFVHEAMHWYQYQNYYPAFLAADRAGVTDDQYGPELEADASCRAVYVHGIPASDYVDTSSPCDVEGWYDGWLLDHLASLGVQVTEPVAADYEVLEVVRP